MDGSIVFARWWQCVLPWGYIGATWRIRLNLCILWSTWVYNPNGKLIGSGVFAQLTAESPCRLLYKGRPYTPELPLPKGTPPNMISWDHVSPKLKQHLDRFSSFSTDDRRMSPYFTMVCAFISPKIAPSYGRLWTPCNTWFLGCTWVLNRNGNLIASAISAWLTSVTDWQTNRQTDHATRLITIGHMYVCSSAMRHKNA